MALVALQALLVAAVYSRDGDVVAQVQEFIVDPDVGIVRFVRLRTAASEDIFLPWAAMTYAKSGTGFVLTRQGEDALAARLPDNAKH